MSNRTNPRHRRKQAGKPGPQSVSWALFSLKGRIRRATYGLGMAFIFAVWWAFVVQLLKLEEDSPELIGFFLLFLVVVLGSGYCMYALAHKRLQDIGFSGFYALLIVPLAFVFQLLIIVPLVAIGFFPGQPKDNPFGPPPVRDLENG